MYSDASEAKPILKCDGLHETEIGYHLDCLPSDYRLEEMPPDDKEWLCPKCCESSLWILAGIRGKKTSHRGKKCVHYLCHWKGYTTDEDTYEPHTNISQRSEARDMVREFNRQEKIRKADQLVTGGKKAKG